mgnify:FL=1
MLAPMEDVTDEAFRELCFLHGADLTFTEMTRLSGLVRRNKSTWQKIAVRGEAPIQIQLATQKEEDLKRFLIDFEPPKGFRGINFNLGCPSPSFIQQGLGCSLVRRVSKVARLVQMVQEKGYPSSIKMRLGLNLFEKKKKVYLNLIQGVPADFFIVHARSGSEHYETKPDDSVYSECVGTGKNIIANGDIDSVEKVNLLKDVGVKGVMIARAAVRNPALFERLKGLKETDAETLKKEYLELLNKYPPGKNVYRDHVLKRLGQEKGTYAVETVMG